MWLDQYVAKWGFAHFFAGWLIFDQKKNAYWPQVSTFIICLDRFWTLLELGYTDHWIVPDNVGLWTFVSYVIRVRLQLNTLGREEFLTLEGVFVP